MVIGLEVSGLIASAMAIIFGVLVIKFPKMISWLIGLYLIIVGFFGLLSTL